LGSSPEADRRDENRYTMVILFPILYLGWKLIHRTKIYKPHEVDLSKNLEEIDEYERNFVPQKAGYVILPIHLIFTLLTSPILGPGLREFLTNCSDRSSQG
jgi:hypothetical protein